MVKIENDIKLGNGIYSIPDLSLILRLPKYKMRRWLNEYWDVRLGKKYHEKYSWGEGRDKATNFHALIEFYVFYQLRSLKVSTKVILQAHEIMADQLNTPYPFATSEVLTDGKKIIYSIHDGTTIKADDSKQIVFKQIIESFYRKIEFSESNLAERFWPLGKERHIVVDPHHQFGQPVIENTNLLAESIHALYKAGETKQFLAKLYSISIREVNDAIEFFNPKVAA